MRTCIKKSGVFVALFVVLVSILRLSGTSWGADEAIYYYDQGFMHLTAGEFEEAISDLSKVIEMQPELLTPYIWRGSAFASQDDYEQAIADYTKAIELDPEHTSAYQLRALAYMSLGEHDKALEDIRELQSLGVEISQGFLDLFEGLDTEELEQTSPRDVSSPESKSFWESKFFGGTYRSPRELKPPPEGSGVLTGRLMYDGQPAENVQLRISLNSEYRTGLVATDESGTFSVSLPVGKWHVNMIQCESWKNKPEGDFILISGDESKLEGPPFQGLFYGSIVGRQGKEVTVTEVAPGEPYIVLNIRRRIEMVWPGGGKERQQATIRGSAIEWAPYPDAENYVVQISRVEHESATRTSFYPVTYKKVSKRNILPLSELTHTADQTAEQEYSVTVLAYGPKGEFLSESVHFGRSTSFLLADGNVLVDTDYLAGVGLNDADDAEIQEVFRGRKLLDAAESLIKEGMFAEAEKLLNKPVHAKLEGKRQAVLGYLYAAQGKCRRADECFKKALAGGWQCIPDVYKGDCK